MATSVYNPSVMGSIAQTFNGSGGSSSSTAATAASLCCRSRTTELLSCARTIVKVEKSRHDHSRRNGTAASDPPNAWWRINPSELRLYDLSAASSQQQQQHLGVLEDGIALLRTMDSELKHLEILVRRRGQTNDPTHEITQTVTRLQTDTQELTVLIQTMIPAAAVRTLQRKRHWQILQQWFQSALQRQGERLKEILKVRGTVLKEQTAARQRRGGGGAPRASTSAGASGSTTTSSTTGSGKTAAAVLAASRKKLDGPRIVRRPAPPPAAQKQSPASVPVQAVNGSSSSHTTTTTTTAGTSSSAAATTLHHPNSAPSTANGGGGGNQKYSYYGNTNTSAAGGYGGAGSGGGATMRHRTAAGYGGGGGGGGGGYGAAGAGYGGGAYSANNKYNMGIRQRRTAGPEQDQQQQQQQDDFQQQLLQRQQERQTLQRVHEARQAEQSLAALGTLFGKMSTLVTQQAEVVDKLEDDVEAAFVDVSAGQREIQTVYSLKKGNRALILKVFGLLIFFIIFMKAYSK